MDTEKLKKAISIAEKIACVFVATADNEKIPYVAAVGKIKLNGTDCVAATEWFCPQTVANLQENKFVSIVAWDEASDSGYQLIG
ncbi:MAG: pyridoxamine 5'-phosphate oxidase family protein [Phycisphaerae bacterium]